jgi:hypothetical protein
MDMVISADFLELFGPHGDADLTEVRRAQQVHDVRDCPMPPPMPPPPHMSAERLEEYLQTATWCERNPAAPEGFRVAYLSAEFGLHESISIYSGAWRLSRRPSEIRQRHGTPPRRIGLLYREGYFRQYLNADGWQQETRVKGVNLAKSMAELGVKRFIHTDISRGSTLTEPNFTAISELISELRLLIIASGGVSSLIHVKMH